jgi:uncharacterized protein YndB with AHSA1/START domain
MANEAASTRTSRIIRATATDLYNAFLDPEALLKWLPPGNMTGKIHSFEPHVGGGYRMSLFYPANSDSHSDSDSYSEAPHPRGKASANEDMVDVRFFHLDPPHKIVEAISFVTDDPALQGEMAMIATFTPTPAGTEVTLTFTNLPPGLRPEDNDKGARLSLEQLARHVEP